MRKVLSVLFVYLPAGAVLASIMLVVLLKWVPITGTPLMLVRKVQNEGNVITKCTWTPLEEISPEMVCAVIAAEDQKFFDHNGFDFDELAEMKSSHLSDGTPVRGCSTISQQTAKNCFTFCSRTWVRKAVEAYFTVLIEKIWGKKRILEVYLNVAEMGLGIYGAEAAAMHYFHIHASDLTMGDASSLACCLPNPLQRSPDWANINMASRRAQVAKDGAVFCRQFCEVVL